MNGPQNRETIPGAHPGGGWPSEETLRPLVELALSEDIGTGDRTTELTVPERLRGQGLGDDDQAHHAGDQEAQEKTKHPQYPITRFHQTRGGELCEIGRNKRRASAQ